MNQVIDVQKDEEGSVVKEILGVSRILDPVLLEEIIKFNEDGNFDRIVAFELALSMAYHLDPIIGKLTNTEPDSRLQQYYKKKSKHIFNSKNSTFSDRRRKIF